jgi:hypothetical protein
MKSLASSLLLALALSAATGCARQMTPDQAMAALRAPDAETRRRAADALRSDSEAGVSPAAVPALLAALDDEPVPAVRGAILITLGRSGAPEAKAPIDQVLRNASDPDMMRWATRALKYWMLQNGEVSGDYKTPYWMPYGEASSKAGRD